MSQYDMYDNILPLILRLFDNDQSLELPWKDLFNGQIKFSQGMKLFLVLSSTRSCT